MPEMEMTKLLTATEVAARLGCSTATILRWVAEGRLTARKLGREWRFPPAAIYALERGIDEES